MIPEDLSDVTWLDPWFSCPPGLEAQLNKEVGADHPLFGQTAISVGRRADCDDVLFCLQNTLTPLAVVHLTWSGPEPDSNWPRTQFFSSLDDWIETCMKRDHIEYIAG
jgi:hypothetical protein